MKRRNLLAGIGGTVIGGSALLGSGAFSRVESQRQVSIQVAPDPDAYLGLTPKHPEYGFEGYANSQNYVDLDEKGHIYIDIGENPNGGQGVNSDSFTFFDDLFEICNNGKEDVMVSYELPDPPEERNIGDDWQAPHEDYDEQVVAFYFVRADGTRVFIDENEPVPLELGECDQIGLRTVTKSIDATNDAPLIDGEVVLSAYVEGA